MTDDMNTDRSGSGLRAARSGLPTPVGRIAGRQRPLRKSQGDTQTTAKALNSSKQSHDKPTSSLTGPQTRSYTTDAAMADSNDQGQLGNATNPHAKDIPTMPSQPVRTAKIPGIAHGAKSSETLDRSQHIPRDEISTGVRYTSDKIARNGVQSLSPYITRRLSTASPEFGPTLRVSSSAERVIMGQGNNNGKTKTIRRVPVPPPKEAHKTRRDHPRTTILHEDRTFPFTGQSLGSNHEPKMARPSSEVRKMRTASEEAQSSLPKEYPNQNMRSMKANSAGSRGTALSTGDDPFFDAQTHVEETHAMHSRPKSSQLEQQAPTQTAGLEGNRRISPVVEQTDNVQGASVILVHREVPTATIPLERADVLPVQHDLPATISNNDIRNPAAANGFTTEAHSTSHKETEETASDFETASHSDQDLAITQSGSFPPRSSSRTPAKERINNNSSSILPALQPTVNWDISAESGVPQNSPSKDAKNDRKRASLQQPSTKSRVLSGVRGLFHKGKKVTVAENGSPMPPLAEVHPAHRPTAASESRRAAHVRAPVTAPMVTSAPVEALPALEAIQIQSGHGNVEIDDAATLVRQVLHLAHTAPPGPEKDRLLALGRTMFGAFTLACDAEMTREAANQSIRRAEISYAQCMQSIMEMAEYVRTGTQG